MFSFSVKDLKKANSQQTYAIQLSAAENDFSKVVQSGYKTLHHQHECVEFMNMIQLATKTLNDKFLKVIDYSGKGWVLYIKNQQAFIPLCEMGYAIELINHTDICFEHLHIFTVYNRQHIILYHDRNLPQCIKY